MSEWWIDDQGRNVLKGSYSDPENPLILPDLTIVEMLLASQPARESFRRLLPGMLPDEQVRLQGLVDLHPRIMKDYIIDDPTLADNLMQAVSHRLVLRDPNKRRR